MIGHLSVRTSLEPGPIAAPMLFLGPRGVGKWTTALHLASVWGASQVLTFKSLTMDNARFVAANAATHPSGIRLYIIQIDASSPVVLNALLKTLEDSTPRTHFILVSAEDPPPAVLSRCEVFRFSLLTENEVSQILQTRNFDEVRANTLAKASGGQASTALEISNQSDVKLLTLAALRAIRTRDEDALDALASRWTSAHTSWLTRMCNESISGRWASFSPAEIGDVDKRLMLRILRALRPEIRPRLVVRSSLMAVLRSV